MREWEDVQKCFLRRAIPSGPGVSTYIGKCAVLEPAWLGWGRRAMDVQFSWRGFVREPSRSGRQWTEESRTVVARSDSQCGPSEEASTQSQIERLWGRSWISEVKEKKRSSVERSFIEIRLLHPPGEP